MDLDAAVLLLSLGGGAAGKGMAVTHADGLNAVSRDPAGDQEVAHLVGALLRQLEVGLVVADGVRMPFDADRDVLPLGERRGQLFDDGLRLRRR